MFAMLDDILGQGVTWVGFELDAAQETKIGDEEMGFECVPFTLKEIMD